MTRKNSFHKGALRRGMCVQEPSCRKLPIVTVAAYCSLIEDTVGPETRKASGGVHGHPLKRGLATTCSTVNTTFSKEEQSQRQTIGHSCPRPSHILLRCVRQAEHQSCDKMRLQCHGQHHQRHERTLPLWQGRFGRRREPISAKRRSEALQEERLHRAHTKTHDERGRNRQAACHHISTSAYLWTVVASGNKST